MTVRTMRGFTGAAALLLLMGVRGPAAAQVRGADRIAPTNAVVISGYGTVGHAYRPNDGPNRVPSAFQASVNPLFLFQFQDRILFEAELEFGLEEGITETQLEYAQADIMVSDNLTVVAGKFLLPFGVFGERLHPTWINKMATMPPIFGHHETGFGAAPILATPSDVGVMARASFRSGSWQLGLNGYVTNGFAVEEHASEDAHEGGAGGGGDGGEEHEIPGIGLPGSSSDVTNNKMVGGRIDLSLPPWVEFNASAFTGKYDEDDRLDMTGFNLAGEVRRAGFELRGEWVLTQQDFLTDEGDVTRLDRSGFYAQVARRFGPWEPVIRFTKVFNDRVGDETEENGAWQTALGLDYWVSPSVAVMASYEFNREVGPSLDNDRFNIHFAFGF